MKKGIIHGWGINNSTYPVSEAQPGKKGRKFCAYYKLWGSVLSRGLSPTKETNPHMLAYKGVTISDDFKYFMDFREWCITQGLSEDNRRDIQLDKDLLFFGNKEYSKKNCCFVPGFLNALLIACDTKRGEFPIGVTLHDKKNRNFIGQMAIDCKINVLGFNKDPMVVHRYWQLAKAKEIDRKVLQYKEHTVEHNYLYREDVTEALYRRSKQLREDAKNGVETIKL